MLVVGVVPPAPWLLSPPWAPASPVSLPYGLPGASNSGRHISNDASSHSFRQLLPTRASACLASADTSIGGSTKAKMLGNKAPAPTFRSGPPKHASEPAAFLVPNFCEPTRRDYLRHFLSGVLCFLFRRASQL